MKLTLQEKRRLGEVISIISPKAIAYNAARHGWRVKQNTTDKDIPELIALMHSELSEALEAYRNGTKPGEDHCIGEEMADLIIRAFHFCYMFDIDIAKEVTKKHIKNIQRPYRHGGKKC